MNVKTTPLKTYLLVLWNCGWFAVGNYQRLSQNSGPFTSHAEDGSHRRSYLAPVLFSLSLPFLLSPCLFRQLFSRSFVILFLRFSIVWPHLSRSTSRIRLVLIVRSRISISKDPFHSLSRRLWCQEVYKAHRFIINYPFVISSRYRFDCKHSLTVKKVHQICLNQNCLNKQNSFSYRRKRTNGCNLMR